MRGLVEWIGACAVPDPPEDAPKTSSRFEKADELAPETSPNELWRSLPAHNFPPQLISPGDGPWDDDPLDRNPDLWMYRSRTVGLLKRYLRFSLETGRLPSFIAREFFRSKVTSYAATTFEDRVIFVRDMELVLERLHSFDQQLIGRIILQEHDQVDTARILHCSRRTVQRRVPVVLDLLSEDFLRVGLLTEGPAKRRSSR